MEIEEALKNRRSVRRYRQKAVSMETLKEIGEICRYAPTGGNRQDWELVLVNDQDIVGDVFSTLAWLPTVGAPPEGKRPTAYLVVISDDKSNGVADCAAITTYALLAAYARGLGSCWFGSIRRTELSKLLEVPETYSIEFVISLGYPDEEFRVENGDGKVRVEDGVTNVPKRRVSDIIHVNSFGNRG